MSLQKFLQEKLNSSQLNEAVGKEIKVGSKVKIIKDSAGSGKEWVGKTGEVIEYPLNPMFGGSTTKRWCLVQVDDMKVEVQLKDIQILKENLNEDLEIVNKGHLMSYKTLADKVTYAFTALQNAYDDIDSLMPENLSPGIRIDFATAIKSGMIHKGFDSNKARANWYKIVDAKIKTMEDVISISSSIEKYKNS
jgi:hypothetical protein